MEVFPLRPALIRMAGTHSWLWVRALNAVYVNRAKVFICISLCFCTHSLSTCAHTHTHTHTYTVLSHDFILFCSSYPGDLQKAKEAGEKWNCDVYVCAALLDSYLISTWVNVTVIWQMTISCWWTYLFMAWEGVS